MDRRRRKRRERERERSLVPCKIEYVSQNYKVGILYRSLSRSTFANFIGTRTYILVLTALPWLRFIVT